ncbi:MAG: lipocalin-like domain-containing protein [Maribacter sp.]|nr:lipocalin-like domain-containing protein [Maribacter sp.]
MKSIQFLLITLILSLFLFSSCAEKNVDSLSNNLEGIWTVIERKMEFSDTTHVTKSPQPSLWIFSDGYYSATNVTGSGHRETFKEASNPTIDEIIKAYKSFSTNTGRYEATDSTLLTFPIIAKVPAYSGGRGIYELTIESDTLYLSMIEEYYENGAKSTWLDNLKVTLKFIKLEK